MYSIIVPIYKVEEYLPECIESILAQTHKDFELVLVDDGSPDNCPGICDEYAQKDDRVRVVHKENGGLISARKAGLAVAEGDYICFVDGDDFIKKDMLETYCKTLSERDVDVICCSFSTYCDGKTEKFAQKVPEGFYDKAKLKEDIYPQMLSTSPFFSFYIIPSVCTKCFKREIAQRIYAEIPQEISLGEDVAVSYPAILCANSISVINYFGYMYRQNQNSMTHTYDKNLFQKVKSLVLYLQAKKSKYQWEETVQIDEYAVYLLYLAKNNELIYNVQDPYHIKKQNLNVYLSDEVFRQAIERVKMKGFADKFILWCFKNRIVFPLHLLSKKK